MTTTVQSILNRAAALLSDEEHVRWPESELLEWLNDGQRVIAAGPASDAYVVRANITTVAGTVQSLPTNAIRLIDVVKNVSSGLPILQSDYAMVNILGGAWRSATAGVAENYFFNENNPKQFEVYPPAVAGQYIEIVYNAQPENATATGNIIIDDMYAAPLIDYIVYRGCSKDTEDSANDLARATAFYRAFMMGVGMKDATDIRIEPRRS